MSEQFNPLPRLNEERNLLAWADRLIGELWRRIGGGGTAGASSIVVRKNSGVNIGTRPRLNLIEGSNITLTVADDAGGNEIDITISTGGGLTHPQVMSRTSLGF